MSQHGLIATPEDVVWVTVGGLDQLMVEPARLCKLSEMIWRWTVSRIEKVFVIIFMRDDLDCQSIF